MAPELLVVGHSHVESLRRPARDRTDVAITVLNLNVLQARSKDKSRSPVDIALASLDGAQPAAICLCLVGNLHNVLGLVEHPRPFSVGVAGSGAAPDCDGTRHFVPHAVMEAELRRQFKAAEPAANRLYGAFPDAARCYLNPPPPLASWDHIRKYPGVFEGKLHLGPGPAPLRSALYDLQSDIMRDLAERHGATFVEAAEETLTEDGFLAEAYCAEDPTHGNAAYGEIMLDRLLAKLDRDKTSKR